MDISAVSAISAQTQAQSEFSTRVLKKALDITATQATQLAQIVDQGAGLGRTIDTTA